MLYFKSFFIILLFGLGLISWNLVEFYDEVLNLYEKIQNKNGNKMDILDNYGHSGLLHSIL